MESVSRYTNLRLFMAMLRNGMVGQDAIDRAKDHYGLPQECTNEDLMESVRDDADASYEQIWEEKQQ